MLDPEILAHYAEGREQGRLLDADGTLEFLRTRELLERHLPPPPADVLDVGGGAGVHAAWLARAGYRVRLIDPVPLHVEQARATSAAQSDAPFAAEVGDARALAQDDSSVDAALLLGPLYHLTDRGERVTALREAARVVRPGGVVAAAAISRFASLLDGLRQGWLGDPDALAIVRRDLAEGQHRNPAADPRWFTTAYFHHPDDLAAEVRDAGLDLAGVFGIEGPGWLLGEEAVAGPAHLAQALIAARAVEREPTLLGLGPHLLAVAHRR